MSFCIKCGAKIEEGINFCANCGNQIEVVSLTEKITKNTSIIKGKITKYSPLVKEKANKYSRMAIEKVDEKLPAVKNKIDNINYKTAVQSIGENKNLFILVVILFAANFIFMHLPAIQASSIALLGGEYIDVNLSRSQLEVTGVSVFVFLNEGGAVFMTVICNLLMLASSIFLILPLMKNSRYTTKNFVLIKIYSIYSILLAFITIVGFLYEISQQPQRTQDIINGSIPIFGYLCILINVALIINVFKLSSKIKKNLELEKNKC